MGTKDILEKIGSKIAEEADVRAVFGDPLKLDDRTVIPVGVVRIRLDDDGVLDLSAQPVGFMSEQDGQVVFKAIEWGGGCGPGCACREEPAPKKPRGKK